MLATLLIWLSVAVAALALIDLFLSKAQKDWLSNAVLKLWIILDEARGWSFADWLKEPRARWWLAVSLGLFTGISIVWPFGQQSSEWDLARVALSVSIALSVCAVITLLMVYFFKQLLDSRPGEFLARRGTEVGIGSASHPQGQAYRICVSVLLGIPCFKRATFPLSWLIVSINVARS